MDNYLPSRTCPCTRCKANDLLAPALLVTFGVLVLLGNVHLVGFGRTWPLMLIVLGGVRVLQSKASTLGHRAPGAGEVPPASPISQDAPAAEVTHE